MPRRGSRLGGFGAAMSPIYFHRPSRFARPFAFGDGNGFGFGAELDDGGFGEEAFKDVGAKSAFEHAAFDFEAVGFGHFEVNAVCDVAAFCVGVYAV